MTQAPLDDIVPTIDEQTETEILREIAEEFSREVYDELAEAFPRYVLSPAVELPPRERLVKYLMRILEAYPNDPNARVLELNNLLNPDFIDLYKQGLAPPPLSRPWSVLIYVPKIFREIQSDFRRCYKAWADRLAT